MHQELAELVTRFRAAQDRGVAFVAEVLGRTLGIRLPTSPMDWVTQCGATRLCDVTWVSGVGVYSHGYGIELTFPDLSIDFDWGDHGEPDGFAAWWLWNFARFNPRLVRCPTHAQVRDWIEDAATRGELTRDTSLYYSSAHRASGLVTSPRCARGDRTAPSVRPCPSS